jgi:hypothetical protein
MTSSPVEQRLRLFCRMLALIACIGAVIELWLVEHTGSLLQWLPFALAALTATSVLCVSRRSTRGIMRAHQLLMLLVLIGSAFGVYSHFSHNMTFAHEIQTSASTRELWIAGVRGGNPLLAAGVLAMAAALGLAGSYGMNSREEAAKS